MEEWKEYKISDVIDEISMGPFGSNIKVDNFIDFGVPVLNGSNLQGFKLNEDSFNYVSQEKADSLGKANAHRGDVVITHRGTLGQIIYIPEDSKYEQYVISQSQFRLKLNQNLIRPDFFVYFFHTRLGQHRILMNASQVGVPALARPTSTFKEVLVPVPPIEVQSKVMDILHSLDDKIEVNRRINDNLEQQAQALFKSWFVDFEPFKDQPFVESELGMVPQGWRVVTLSDACSKITDGSHYSPKDDPFGTIPMLSVKDMLHNGFDYSSCKKINEEEYEKMKANDCVPRTKDILVAKDGSYLKEIFMCTEEIKQAILSSIAIFRSNADVIFPEILLQLLRLPKVKKDVGDNYVSGSALPRIVLKDFKKFKFIMAPIDIQNEVIESLRSLNVRIHINDKESSRLAELRDTLLPRLMSGELKVNEVET